MDSQTGHVCEPVLALGSKFKGGNPPIPKKLRGIFKIWGGVRDHEYQNFAKILPFLTFKQLYYFSALTIDSLAKQMGGKFPLKFKSAGIPLSRCLMRTLPPPTELVVRNMFWVSEYVRK